MWTSGIIILLFAKTYSSATYLASREFQQGAVQCTQNAAVGHHLHGKPDLPADLDMAP
jgi:hypothetical protein